MSVFKKFFEKKKLEAKFKMAGPGQKLGDASAAAAEAAAAAAADRQASMEEQRAVRARRAAAASGGGMTSEQQRQAAAAAIQRYQNQSSSSSNFEKNRSQAAIRSMALKELEKENKMLAEMEAMKNVYGEKPTVTLEAPSVLGCDGVFFKCPLIGDGDLLLPKKEMQARIRQFLYDQLDTEDRGLTSCLIICTLNTDKEKVKVCVETLCKYLENIVDNPEDEKFRKIRQTNKAYLERVKPVEGHDLFLTSCGFQTQTIDGQDFWLFEAPPASGDGGGGTIGGVERLKVMREALMTAEPIRAELDRGLKVLLPSEASKKVDLPPDFFSISAEELQREMQARAEAVERQGILRTKAMREREQQMEKRRYRYALIRIRFPDSLVLQGTFSVYEKFSALLEFVAENLEHPLPFVLYGSGGMVDAHLSSDKTLLDLGYYPTVMLTFNWHPEVAEEVEAQLASLTVGGGTSEKPPYLRHDLVQATLLQYAGN